MNNKLIVAALAGVFAVATPIAILAEEAAAPESMKNGCNGKMKMDEGSAPAAPEGSAPAAPAPETK